MSVRAALAVVALALLCFGCGVPTWSPATPSGTDQEFHILSETDRFAGLLRVKVRGVLTDSAYMIQPGAYGCPGPVGCTAAGWYESGIAYYYRPYIVKQTDFGYLSGIAAHEVCHAVEYGHNKKHEACIASVYP